MTNVREILAKAVATIDHLKDYCTEPAERVQVDAVMLELEALDAAGLTISRKGEAEEAYELGERDGYEGAVQDLDQATGGDGEFICVLGGPDDRHCPDADHMKARIIGRFRASPKGETDALREMAQRIYDIAQPLEGKTPFGQLVSVGDKLMGLARTALANTDGGWNYDLDDAPTGWPLDVASKGVAGPEVGIREVHADGSTTWLILDAGLADGSSPGWCHRLDAPVYAWRARPTPPTEAE